MPTPDHQLSAVMRAIISRPEFWKLVKNPEKGYDLTVSAELRIDGGFARALVAESGDERYRDLVGLPLGGDDE